MNLKVLTLSAAVSTMLTAATPMVSTSMSTDNGGTKSAIDAYSDGGGVVVVNQTGDAKIDNSAMNSLVFKYGETAKSSNTTLKNQVTVLSADATASEKAESVKLDLAKAIIVTSSNSGPCDDLDPQTSNDIWINGVCRGSMPNGTVCNDDNINTIDDKYRNGICTGLTQVANTTAFIPDSLPIWGSIFLDNGITGDFVLSFRLSNSIDANTRSSISFLATPGYSYFIDSQYTSNGLSYTTPTGTTYNYNGITTTLANNTDYTVKYNKDNKTLELFNKTTNAKYFTLNIIQDITDIKVIRRNPNNQSITYQLYK